VLKFKRKLADDVYERLRKSWSSGHSGENAGKTAIIEDDGDFTPLTFSSVDLQFQELRSFQVIEIARALGVPPNLLMDFGRATWGNAEQMAQGFLTFTLLPRMKLWAGAVSRLLSADEQAQFVPEFVADALVQAEIAARFEAYAKAITNGIFNPNEVRALENRAPYKGGNEFRVPMNTEPPGGAPIQPARHHWACQCVMAGIDLETIKQEGGWKSLRMVERYATVTAEHRTHAMSKLA
jgi:HK97 family phage portal protein